MTRKRKAAVLLALAAVPLSGWGQKTPESASSRIGEHLSAAVLARDQKMPRLVIRQLNLAWGLAKDDLELRRTFIQQAVGLGIPAAARKACVETLSLAPQDGALHGSCGESYLALKHYNNPPELASIH